MMPFTDQLMIYKARVAHNRLDTALTRLDDYKRLVTALSTGDVHRLRHILSTALKQNVSVKVILATVEHAMTEIYHTRGFTEDELDLASLVRVLGGRKCLFALSKAMGLPSSSTVSKIAMSPDISPSPSVPQRHEIVANLAASFPTPSADNKQKRGHCVMLDGVAVDRRLRYYKKTKQIIGLCRHALQP
jgi:hypothetical protein